MSIIVRDGAFCEDRWLAAGGSFHAFDQVALRTYEFEADKTGVDVTNDLDPDSLTGFFDLVSAIRIPFPSFADGRGFSIARRLRQLGFEGMLRAQGHVLADQYPLAIRCGFDEIEITAELAQRHDETQWADSFTRVSANYQNHLKAAPGASALH